MKLLLVGFNCNVARQSFQTAPGPKLGWVQMTLFFHVKRRVCELQREIICVAAHNLVLRHFAASVAVLSLGVFQVNQILHQI